MNGQELLTEEQKAELPEELQRRQSRVINRDYVKRWALDYAKDKRSHPFSRVSETFLNAVEVETKNAIRDRINKHPSKGKTLQ